MDILKIDKTSVDGLGENPGDTAIVDAMIGLADDALRLMVAA